ncbi:MAG TPA: prephenate dehydrogenase/arogenate dehydrogenase family protein [Pyrinomonadaceae bacterium]|nr:prephenate dehydrogenase/arogenate dehydrogenase family protein [Pyrinomonadaceae bacterium]
MTRRWHRVTIVGCGLIGASFALALRNANACELIAGWDSEQSELDEAVRTGVIDEVDQAFASAGPAGAISSSDLIYLSMPVGEIIDFLRERGGQIKAGAVITDAGSTKVEICRAAQSHLANHHRFVGGHPIAGSHLHGLAHARGDLFSGAPYVLIADEVRGPQPALTALRETIEEMGASVTCMSAADHDRAMALVSHLPQIVSSALAAATRNQPDAENLVNISGAGYRDMTRLASSPWSMWHDILATNSKETAAALDELIARLASVRDDLRAYSGRGIDLNKTRQLFDENRAAIKPSRSQEGN